MNDKILKMIEDRLEVGRKKYGTEVNPFDGRDWLQEAIEECADMLVYLCTAKIKLDKKKENNLYSKDY